MIDEGIDLDLEVLQILRNGARSRIRLARAMLDAFAANAFASPTTQEDTANWTKELADAKRELDRLSN
jgi:hypothetical protein